MIPSAISYSKVLARFNKHPYDYKACPACGKIMRRYSSQCRECRNAFRPYVEQPDDPSIRLIPLTQGYCAIIDAEDYEKANRRKYHAIKCGKNIYARSEDQPSDGPRVTYWLHIEIFGEAPNGMVVDHINNFGLDNRKTNLRICLIRENVTNQKIARHNTSGFKGVSRTHKCTAPWRATITSKGVQYSLGSFWTPEAAHAAYCTAALRLHGEFANFG